MGAGSDVTTMAIMKPRVMETLTKTERRLIADRANATARSGKYTSFAGA